jgi:hypothetical protein
MNKLSIFSVTAVSCIISLYSASLWWEKAFATPIASWLSPDKCLRIESFRPFWILPSSLQPMWDPDDPTWIDIDAWQSPGFYRLYEEATGLLLGESVIFDAWLTSGRIDWDDWEGDARVISQGPYTIAVTTRCAGEESKRAMYRYSHKLGEFSVGVR